MWARPLARLHTIPTLYLSERLTLSLHKLSKLLNGSLGALVVLDLGAHLNDLRVVERVRGGAGTGGSVQGRNSPRSALHERPGDETGRSEDGEHGGGCCDGEKPGLVSS